MTKLVDASLVDGTPVVFAKNKLVIVTKPGNPKNVKTLADLATCRHGLAVRRHRAVREVRGPDPADCRGDDPRDRASPAVRT